MVETGDGWSSDGLENLDILKMDGPTIMDWGGFISVPMEKMEFGCGEGAWLAME